MCLDMVLELKGPVSMPLSGLAPLYGGFVAGQDGGQLARIDHELLDLERGFLSLVRLESVGSSGG